MMCYERINIDGFYRRCFTQLTEVDTDALQDNQYHVQKDGQYHVRTVSGKLGGLTIPFNMNVGDKIRCSLELKSISGVKPKVAFDKAGVGNINNTSNFSYEANKYVPLSIEAVVTQAGLYNLVIGLYTADVGEYIVRNIRINVDTNHHYVEERLYSLQYKSGVWTSVNNPTREKFQVEKDTIADAFIFRYETPFILGVPFVLAQADYSTDYSVKIGNVTKDSFGFKFYKNDMLVKISELKDLYVTFTAKSVG